MWIGIPGRPPSLTRKWPRPGGSASSPETESQAGGSCQLISSSCSACESGTAWVSMAISAAGSPPQMTMPARSTKPRAFMRSSGWGRAMRSLMVCEHIATPMPLVRFRRVSASTRSTMPWPARSARHSSSRITK